MVNAASVRDTTELIFLGTGTSSSLPHVSCLTAPLDQPPCKTCLSTLTPTGKKNIRRNTSAALRLRASDGRLVTIVIDVGKTFQAAAVEWFPKCGLRKIDAVVITHAHADAMNGLDDLRGWTLHGAIQPHIDVYLSRETFSEVRRSFPYLVSKQFASGGGDVPEFRWHIIFDKCPFEIGDTGINITPFLVHHGRTFAVVPPPAYIPTPVETTPSAPRSEVMSLPNEQDGGRESDRKEASIQPYTCFGFKIQNEIAYVSDVSFIPEDVWPLLQSIPILVLDCLRLEPHTSHFGLAEAVKAARRVGAGRTYLTGFGHHLLHDEYVAIGEVAGGSLREAGTENERRGMELISPGTPVWIRPAHDGSLLMKLLTHSFLYDDPWSIVSLAFFLRYPNPYATHVLSCDVISRVQTPTGSLLTTRLILKKGSLPRWAPKGIISRAETWVLEETEVDPVAKTVRCRTKNLDHVKVMQVEESTFFHQTPEGKTLQITEARIRSGFGWGLTKRIENYGLNRFKANMQRSREGVSLILDLLRQSRLQPMTLGGVEPIGSRTDDSSRTENASRPTTKAGLWHKLRSWLQPPAT